MIEKDELSAPPNSDVVNGRWANIRKRLDKAADSAGALANKGTQNGSKLLRKTRDTTQTAVAHL